MRKLIILPLAFLIQLLIYPVFAWDAVGHRITASIAFHFLNEESKTKLIQIIENHPRYIEDFRDAMPASVRRSSEQQQLNWLLGQAAYWPDLARGLPAADREKYNRPNWHYTDGAWNRGLAQMQGNQYIDINPFPDIGGETPSSITESDDAHNVSTALDYNTNLLANPDSDPAERAIALCWVLHLMGDIHQPLHTGSLYSENLFSTGDRGGNGISTNRGNLHSTWDSALREDGIQSSVEEILQLQEVSSTALAEAQNSDWDLWLSESRQLLLSQVYSEEMIEAISNADRGNSRLRNFDLSSEYIEQMKQSAGQRLGLAGVRLALWFNTELP